MHVIKYVTIIMIWIHFNFPLFFRIFEYYTLSVSRYSLGRTWFMLTNPCPNLKIRIDEKKSMHKWSEEQQLILRMRIFCKLTKTTMLVREPPNQQHWPATSNLVVRPFPKIKSCVKWLYSTYETYLCFLFSLFFYTDSYDKQAQT